MKKTVRALSLMLALILTISVLLSASFSAETLEVTRTVMMYCVGSDLESYDALATDNLIQAMESDYNENLNFIVITGGSTKWCMPEEYLSGADEISTTVNQVWKLEGKRSGEEHGMITLLEPDGICDKPISDPSTLTAFVDYCYANDPADIYDLLMWDHGAGPVYGFGIDNNNSNKTLSLQETVQAFDASSFIQEGNRFDLINYDACLMSSVEVIAAQAYAEANGINFREDKEPLLGDVDGDGEVEIIDSTFIQRKLASMPISFEWSDTVADTDEDNEVTILDATFIQRWLASLPSNDHIGKPIV